MLRLGRSRYRFDIILESLRVEHVLGRVLVLLHSISHLFDEWLVDRDILPLPGRIRLLLDVLVLLVHSSGSGRYTERFEIEGVEHVTLRGWSAFYSKLASLSSAE